MVGGPDQAQGGRSRLQRRVREHMGATVQLAAPVVVARAGLLTIVVADTIMTGHAGAAELAALGLGYSVQGALMLLGIGMLQGTAVLVSQADGAREPHLCGGIWRVGLLHAVVLGLLFGGLCLAGEAFFRAIGQNPDLARGGGAVMRMFSWGMPPILIYVATTAFLEGVQRPRPGMIVMLGANLLNIGLNWIFIYGHAGAPAMGAVGAVLATGIVRWGAAAALVGYALWMPEAGHFGVRAAIPDPAALARRLRQIGYPIGLAQGLETTAFMTVAMFAGYLGTTALAGYQIAINLVSLIFMCAIGIATATSVRVGNAVGMKDQPGIGLAGWSGLALVVAITGSLALLLAAMPAAIAGLYAGDPAVIAAAAAALAMAALFLVFDGGQAVLMGALRGTGDVRVPLLVQGIAFWGLAIPFSWLFAVTWSMGPAGLMAGLFVGVVVSAVTLTARFAWIARGAIGRI